jgi:hypothetical protein
VSWRLREIAECSRAVMSYAFGLCHELPDHAGGCVLIGLDRSVLSYTLRLAKHARV